jgi:2-phosphosulfolactate phosphatase
MGANDPARGIIHFEWGWRGAALAAERGDVLAIVDVLSFSTTAVTAAMNGARIYPCVDDVEAREFALNRGAEAATRREHVPERGRFSLSPTTFLCATSMDHVALPSPNGATCCRLGASAPAVLIASLLNASAAARAAALLMRHHNVDLTVLACGERWTKPSEEGLLRFALEDYLGAGALLAALDLPFSPEARVCRAAFNGVRDNLLEHLAGCTSGIELQERGWFQDVAHAAQFDLCDVVPRLVDGCLLPNAL